VLRISRGFESHPFRPASSFVPISESNSPLRRIQSGNEIGVASETFNSTLLTSLLSFYECTLSLSLSLNHHHPDLVHSCLGANSAEHDAVIAFPDYE
jgi:hypothetical protein